METFLLGRLKINKQTHRQASSQTFYSQGLGYGLAGSFGSESHTSAIKSSRTAIISRLRYS